MKEKSTLKEILVQWGELALKLNKLPVYADWSFHNCSPSIDGINRSHNLKWAEFPDRFFDLYSGSDEWKDVLSLIPHRSMNQSLTPQPSDESKGLDYELSKYIPPIVNDLIDLSLNEEKSREFEKNVNLVFQMLGFDVTDYGQGTGRNPDGVAKDYQNRYAILIDAKSRGGNYRIGTEDRKFIEYIRTFSEPLRNAGFTNTYFLVVSSGFEPISAIAIKNIRVETQVNITFLTSRLLLRLLSTKVHLPRLFSLKKFQELLIEDGEISENKIDRFISKLK